MKINVIRAIEQVADGTLYRGNIEIGGIRFEYEMRFAIPIPQLDACERPADVRSVREVIKLTVRHPEIIELGDKEFMLFIHMLLIPVVKFYNNPMNRICNDLCEKIPHGEDGVPAYMRVTENLTYEFTEQACTLLSEKLGCTFTV